MAEGSNLPLLHAGRRSTLRIEFVRESPALRWWAVISATHELAATKRSLAPAGGANIGSPANAGRHGSRAAAGDHERVDRGRSTVDPAQSASMMLDDGICRTASTFASIASWVVSTPLLMPSHVECQPAAVSSHRLLPERDGQCCDRSVWSALASAGRRSARSGGTTRTIDVGLIVRDGEVRAVFLLWAGVGIDVSLIDAVARRRSQYREWRLLAEYVSEGLRMAFHYRFPTIVVTSREADGAFGAVVIANVGKLIFETISGAADPSDRSTRSDRDFSSGGPRTSSINCPPVTQGRFRASWTTGLSATASCFGHSVNIET